jgi:hypothetical protein
MIETSCHCGAVKITVDVEAAPEQLTSCNCSICRRLGTLWAYYPPTKVRVLGDTATYCWGDKSLSLHRCVTCGCVTHWVPVDPAYERMGVNARLMDPALIAGVRVRRIDGAETWEYLD